MIDTGNILTDALGHAFETMAFMEILPLGQDTLASEDLFSAEIAFVGPRHGAIQILAGREFAEILAENIAALDEVTEDDCRDALKELVNVACGLVTPELGSDTSDVFDLTIPTTSHDASTPRWHEFLAQEETEALNVEGHLVGVRLVVHDCLHVSIE